MKTIEERATEWSENPFNEVVKEAAFISYTKGATDQRAIDEEKLIEKACEAYCKSQCRRITSDCRLCPQYKAFRNYLLNK